MRDPGHLPRPGALGCTLANGGMNPVTRERAIDER
jgi:hypothetical protein